MGQIASNGVSVAGSPYRYTAMSPNVRMARTIVTRIDREGGRIDRWWHLPGTYVIPAVAYDLTGGGLSADGSTLVLSRFSKVYPPPISRFAILDTRVYLRHPRRGDRDRPRHAISRVALEGDFSFDAISPDGTTIYLAQRLPRYRGNEYIANHAIRAFDVRNGQLMPEPILSADDEVDGVPIARTASPDGRWAYTLYDGNAAAEDGGVPFVDALDTATGRMERIELAQLAQRRNLFTLKMRSERGGLELSVLALRPRSPGLRPLLTIDTETHRIAQPSANAESDFPIWLPLGVLLLAAAGLSVWVTKRGRGVSGHKGPERV